jgi:hypothetical protein
MKTLSPCSAFSAELMSEIGVRSCQWVLLVPASCPFDTRWSETGCDDFGRKSLI